MSATEAAPMLAGRAARLEDPIRVLLIEDDEADYWHARDLLDAAPHARFTIDWARDLQSGLARLAPAAFDVCLLEQALPDGDGLEIVRAAPSRGCDAPIIMLTGRGSLDLDLQAMALGAADYLDKTRIDATLLERTIRYALNRRQQAQRLSRLAQHDELTGLANRSLFNDRLERALAWARRHERIAAVMVLDLNGFKAVNDRLGHVAGDRLLTIMGMRLSGRLRETDTVARLGGDEFALVVENLAKPEHAGLVARKLLDAVVSPITIDSHSVTVSASLGVALYPQDGSVGATLLREADRAMYRAKAEGGNLCRFGSDRIQRRVQRGALVESDLRRALEQGELVLRYQPQINLVDARMAAATGTGIGLAGLLHWDHPELGLIGAERFTALAEDSGMLEALTDWMIEAACAQGHAWQAMGFHHLHLAVPLLSRRQLAWSGLAQRLQDCLHAAGLDASRLEIELGEDVLLGESATGLRAFKELGVRIALDGFGRGPTSLRSLQLGILDTLKLARDWHHRPADDPAHAHFTPGPDPRRAIASGHTAVVAAIITLARELGLRVVAEAADDPMQLAYLRRSGCTAVQGIVSGAPLPPQACTSWLRKATRRRMLAAAQGAPPAAGEASPSTAPMAAER